MPFIRIRLYIITNNWLLNSISNSVGDINDMSAVLDFTCSVRVYAEKVYEHVR